MGAATQPLTLKILMLHGFTQNGRLFSIKTKALKKSLEKAFPPAPQPGHLLAYPGGVELVYPTAPIALRPVDVPGYDVEGPSSGANDDSDDNVPEAFGWWRRSGDEKPYVYEGMEAGLASLAAELRARGPFHGVIGFSQGAAAAAMVASLLEPGRVAAFDARADSWPFPSAFLREHAAGGARVPLQPPMKFAVAVSGFAASDANPAYEPFYQPRVVTPMLHVLGSVDTVVSEDRSLRLVKACENAEGVKGGVARVFYHPGGHFLPSSSRQFISALVNFIREAIDDGRPGGLQNGDKEGRVEDMDMPF